MSNTNITWFEINDLIREFVPEKLRTETVNRIFDKISHLNYRLLDNDKLITDLVNENTRLVKENLKLVKRIDELIKAGDDLIKSSGNLLDALGL